MMKRRYWIMMILVAGLLALAGCNNPTATTGGNGDGDTPAEYIPGSLEWTWVSGSNTGNESGTYGTKGVADASNVPGARYKSVSWTDSSGDFWLFGGDGYDGALSSGSLNDLWRFDS